jgi:hypothetical protein
MKIPEVDELRVAIGPGAPDVDIAGVSKDYP